MSGLLLVLIEETLHGTQVAYRIIGPLSPIMTMIFSRASQYAIRALAYLAVRYSSGLLPLEQIASDEKIPQPFLGKILQGLTHKRLVRSSKGLNGGFALAVSPEKITLYSIVDAIDSVSLSESDCILGQSNCSEEKPCPLHDYWKIERANQLKFLRSVTLQQVCAENRLMRGHDAGARGGAGKIPKKRRESVASKNGRSKKLPVLLEEE